jgi:transposase
MNKHFQVPLNLPDIQILEVGQTDSGAWLIEVESTLQETQCRKCGKTITEFHGFDAPIRLRHLPIFEVPVYLEIRPKRSRCRECEAGPTSTQILSWYKRRSPHTKAYDQWLLKLLVNSTVSDVSEKAGVSEAAVIGVLDRWVETSVDWSTIESIRVLGIDEIALKRGHRDFVVLVTSQSSTGVEILAVLPDRTKETVLAFLESIPERLKATIKVVCTDMYRGYEGAIHAALPGAKQVVDRFHVAQAYRDCADKVRKQEMKRLKQELPEAEYKTFKGVMWSFRKREADLQDHELEQLADFFERSPKAAQAYELRQELTDIFEDSYSKAGAKCAIRAWCKRVKKSGLSAFDSFLTTIDNWLDEITNYFLEGHNSGFVEGFNNRVKVLKRRCYGIFGTCRIFQRLILDTQGYQRFRQVSAP